MTIADIALLASRTLAGASCLETVADARPGPNAIQGCGLFSTRERAAGALLCVLDGQAIDVARHPHQLRHQQPQHAPNVAVDADGRSMRACRAVAAGEKLAMGHVAQPVPAACLRSAETRGAARHALAFRTRAPARSHRAGRAPVRAAAWRPGPVAHPRPRSTTS